MAKWTKTVQKEIELRCGDEVLLLLSDERKDPVFKKGVLRWILVVRDTGYQQVLAIAGDLFRRMPDLNEVFNLRVLTYQQMMDWGVAGWPEWLQALKEAKFIKGDERLLERIVNRHTTAETAVDLPALINLIEQSRSSIEGEVAGKIRDLVKSYFHLVMLDLQAAYLNKYPHIKRSTLVNLGSPEAIIQELSIDEDEGLRRKAALARELSSTLQRESPSGDILEHLFAHYQSNDSETE